MNHVLVTGGAGFIGSRVVRGLVSAGHDVTNLDALTYAGHVESLGEAPDAPNHSLEVVDIRDREAVRRIISAARPDAVIHLAAESHVDRSIDTFVADRPGHDRRYAIDSTRVRKELGWRPVLDLDEGLGRTVRWYLENRWWWQAIRDGGFEDRRRQGRPDG